MQYNGDGAAVAVISPLLRLREGSTPLSLLPPGPGDTCGLLSKNLRLPVGVGVCTCIS